MLILRVDIESAVRSSSPQRPAAPAPETFQASTFAQQTHRPRASSAAGVPPTFAQVVAQQGSPARPPPKRQRTAAREPSSPVGRPATTTFQSPPRRIPDVPNRASSVEQRLANTERQLEAMQRMLQQILLSLPGPAVQVPSFYPLQSDTDSHMEPAKVEGLEGSDAFYAERADDAHP